MPHARGPRPVSFARRAAAWAALISLAASCGGKGSSTPSGSIGSASPLTDRAFVLVKDAPPGLDLHLSEGKAGPPAFDRARLAPARKLPDAAAQAMLSRATPIQRDPADTQAFALRPASHPPPRTGDTVTQSFPPPPSSLKPPAVNDAHQPLTVLRYMPEGAVPVAPELSVTFSQPMVAVTSQGDAAGVVPVKLTPQPKGKWRWIGTRTILFDPEVRFPQATTYKVEIPAGTKSANGGVLAAAKTFTFETPPPKLVASFPSSYQPHHLDAPMFALFDQKIDPQAVARALKVTVDGKPWAIQVLDAAALDQLAAGKSTEGRELAARIDAVKRDGQDGRWVAFRASQPFPKDASIEVTIPAGTRGTEGPNPTTAAQSFQFRTYPPLKITRAQCGYGGPCPPGAPLVIQFNNPLDADKLEDAWITVKPDVPQLRIVPSGNSIVVVGATKAHTRYEAVVSAGVTDQFGQTLGDDTPEPWEVGAAVPTFYGPQGMVVVDPLAKRPTLDVFSTNYEALKVQLYRVTPADFDAYNTYLRERWNRNHPPKLPGTKVFDQLVKTTQGKDQLVETSVDLSPALTRGRGHVIAVVEPTPWTQSYNPPRLVSWVQVTHLAVDAYVDANDLIAFATELDTGKPATGVALEIRPFGIKGTSDAKGMATLPLATSGPTGAHYLVARRGDDVAFVGDRVGYYSTYGSWVKQARGPALAWYVIDDRKMYKPGEEVSLKGWLRTIDHREGGDIGASGVTSISYTVRDSRNVELAKGTAQVTAAGGFATKFTLPKTPNLGYARVELAASGRGGWTSGTTYYHSFQIQEFRRPEFEVTASPSQGPFLIGGGGDVTVKAAYYAGGPLPGAPVSWIVRANPTSFTPPNRDQFVFGKWTPWWGYTAWYDTDARGGRAAAQKSWTLTGKTDATGAHTAHLDFLSANPAVPMSVTAHATVTDVNRQAWTASSALIVHPASLYVGLRTKKPFVEKNVPFDVEVIGVDLDGKAVPGAKVEVRASRVEWKYEHGKYVEKEVDPQTCTPRIATDPATCTFGTAVGGTYQVVATIFDDLGRPNQTTLTFWVSGGDLPKRRDVTQEKVQIIPDHKDYAPGSTAELLVQAPFYPAEGVVSWRRSGIVKTERIRMTGPTQVLHVPITDAMTPNLIVQVDLVGMAPRLDDQGDPDPKLPPRPAYAVGQINLPIPPRQRTLAVTVAPNAAKLGPGEHARITVDVKDAAGRPVANAETAVIVVDEAILALSGYQFPNPVDTFYGRRGADARDHYLRAYVKLARPDVTLLQGQTQTGAGYAANAAPAAPQAAVARGRVMGGALDKAAVDEDTMVALEYKEKDAERADGKDNGGRRQPGGSQPIAIRANFNPLAAFAPAVKTNAAGRAVVDLKLPDNLTRYRIVAIATAGDRQFGKGESTLTARLPLMVRPSPPRFLNFGDTFRLPVVVQNQTDAPMSVRLAVRATNAAITDGAGREVVVPANDRVEVQFPAAAEMAGTARFQIVGTAGPYSDAAELALPVWTPATTEAFATYGVIDRGAIKQPVALPGKVVTQFGGIEVTTASTNLQALTDALLYLVRYPFECAEQRSSRILAVVALQDVLAAFHTRDLPTPQAMRTSVEDDVEHLANLQNNDGGFAYWERGRPSEPYVSVYVASALARAKAKGYDVPQRVLDRARDYLRNIERYYPPYYSEDIKHSISAFALYTRKQMGDLDVAKAKALLRDAGGPAKLQMEANGWLLGTLTRQASAAAERRAIVRHAMNHVSETAGAANFTTRYRDGSYLLLSSDRRVDAVMLESLIQEQPKLDLIPKLVTGLLAHRKAGRWLNTQENTFALLAMDLYFHTYEKTTPNFVARVWLGDAYAGDHAFRGRTTETLAIPIAMKDVAAHDHQALTIQKDGAGRLYYRIGMTYAPASLKLEPADYGFVVTRIYEGVDDPGDVVHQPDGTWKIKAGARVRVKLTMVNENRRYHVALVDPLPAGLEPMNPALAVTGPIPHDPNQQKARGAYWWWYGPWYEHQNMRDERVEAFASLLWEGVHEYEYVARATTPGNFVVPPPKAEEMYMPETFGRGGSDRVIVE